jgi:hypothetical protein
MNALKRFYMLGAAAADRRVAGALTPPPLDDADHYLKDSAFASVLERITIRLHHWWLSSQAKQLSSTIAGRLERERVAFMMLIAVATHVILTLYQGVYTGWFWLIIPAIAALFAALVLAAGRAATE